MPGVGEKYSGKKHLYHMFKHDNDYIKQMQQSDINRMTIPDNLENVRLIGDTSDTNREVKFKLRREYVKGIFDYLTEHNKFYK